MKKYKKELLQKKIENRIGKGEFLLNRSPTGELESEFNIYSRLFQNSLRFQHQKQTLFVRSNQLDTCALLLLIEMGHPVKCVNINTSLFNFKSLLVSNATGFLQLRNEVIHSASLEDFDQFSHAWLIFIFHRNTNQAR